MKRQLQADVVVVGGGASGTAAAAAASAAGADVLLLERNPYLGGQATASQVPAFCGFCTHGDSWKQVVRGFGQEVLDQMAARGYFQDFTLSPSGNRIVPQDPEVTKIILEDLLDAHQVHYLFHAEVIDAEVKDGVIGRVICRDDEGTFTVSGRMFVDASGEANLAYVAKAPVEFHHEQKGSMMFRIGGIGEGVDLSPDAMQKAIQAAEQDGVQGITVHRGVMIPVQGTRDGLVNMIALDFPGLDAETMTAAEKLGRRQAALYTEIFRKYVPGMEHSYLVLTGPKVGLRESRRIVGLETLTKEDVKSSRKRPDGIARGGWGAELHVGKGETQWGFERGDKYFDIPLNCLIPQGMQNLFCAGRTISSDLTASASIRVMGTGFATGQAAGAAAALACQGIRDVDAVRAELQKQHALI